MIPLCKIYQHLLQTTSSHHLLMMLINNRQLCETSNNQLNGTNYRKKEHIFNFETDIDTNENKTCY